MATIKPVLTKAKKLYVETMMQVIGRALQAISQVDNVIKKDAQPLPTGFIVQMKVLPRGSAFCIQKQADGTLKYLGAEADRKPDLCIAFKHVTHAFLVFAFQESTSMAFAHDRMVVDGEIGYALAVTRILNRLESFILPKLLAERALKAYPANLQLPEKLIHGARIYLQLATNLVKVN
jgi:hypothetical protein